MNKAYLEVREKLTDVTGQLDKLKRNATDTSEGKTIQRLIEENRRLTKKLQDYTQILTRADEKQKEDAQTIAVLESLCEKEQVEKVRIRMYLKQDTMVPQLCKI